MNAALDQMDYWDAHALLEWQIELGASDPISEAPINRFEVPKSAPKPAAKAATPPAPVETPEVDPQAEAVAAAKRADSLDALRAEMNAFAHCDLKKGARNLVFCDGDPRARVMVVGEAPGREEDRQGKPFVGRSGQLLDKMFEAIGLSRGADDPASALYITNTLPWAPPQNRDPSNEEVAMLKPFLLRHIELADPKVLVLVGNWSCHALLGKTGITKLRGNWAEVLGRPAMPMTHPAYLLRRPEFKREAWADLLEIQARLRGLS
ncbi:uracil-DNA glycosylase [Celeribacter sp.]|uniref:uracil-DNA glycosylase n=1 Tax=Celeribacter sp. TaxID=1890673 RepID=UPI003A8FFB75